mmetsp:Transcript_36712/g.72041  ORF Transcript_36712/g.72041 Transcript_36712/m.72041 type:complete len:363 (+) Transcript_36712:79-1167(+)|eukprot:CAMPEP_0175088936 /NCGR_PEP_ID=MMETSP0086_2-20121207/518_1 /TAXON_ID=136419 /ORGANISM="Unknown Unknown, Strain D1" /LENGTH=362 /DNA_ID=CAMNT_0016361411 /DNA_START=76 /DNA_END=1164 /DNA_ORIENTATION=+
MDLLKAALNDRKKTLVSKRWQRKSDDSDSDDEPQPKKYLRRGEVKQLQEEKKKKNEKEAPAAKKESRTDSGLKKVISTKKDEYNSDDEENAKVNSRYLIGPDEVKRRLRACMQPLTLFGETDNDRLSRLKIFELNAIEKHGASDGRANEFADIIAREVENEILQATVNAMESENAEEAAKIAAKKLKAQQKRHNKYSKPKSREQFTSDEDFLIFFFKRILSQWEEALDERSIDEKKTTSGKMASATHKQTRQYIKPFFKELKKGQIPQDLKVGVIKIAEFCLEREYVKANEQYMMIAIGNAAWPMGVTSVGIHERAGRSKIYKSNIAHVLNSETSRKYIQAIKRLMTQNQLICPADPSKMVN